MSSSHIPRASESDIDKRRKYLSLSKATRALLNPAGKKASADETLANASTSTASKHMSLPHLSRANALSEASTEYRQLRSYQKKAEAEPSALSSPPKCSLRSKTPPQRHTMTSHSVSEDSDISKKSRMGALKEACDAFGHKVRKNTSKSLKLAGLKPSSSKGKQAENQKAANTGKGSSLYSAMVSEGLLGRNSQSIGKSTVGELLGLQQNNTEKANSNGASEFSEVQMDNLAALAKPSDKGKETIERSKTNLVETENSSADWREFTSVEEYEEQSKHMDSIIIEEVHEKPEEAANISIVSEENEHVMSNIEDLGSAGIAVSRTLLTLLIDYSQTLADLSITALKSILPLKLHVYLTSLSPVLQHIFFYIEILLALLLFVLELLAEFCYMLWRLGRPFHPGLLMLSLTGLVVCFFGGFFTLTIAAMEAFSLCGYSTTLSSLQHISEDIQKYLKSKKRPYYSNENNKNIDDHANNDTDNVENDNNDTVNDSSIDSSTNASSSTLDSRGYILQQIYLFMVHIDPQRLSEALVGLNSGFVAVITTLKLQFAKTFTLGNAIGKSLEPPVLAYIQPLVSRILPADLEKWSPYLCRYGLKVLAISVAWYLRRVIASYHSALRGGSLCARYLSRYLVAIRFISRARMAQCNYIVVIMGYVIAGLGLYLQFVCKYQLPYPLNIILFPVTILENALLWVVNHSIYLPSLGIV